MERALIGPAGPGSERQARPAIVPPDEAVGAKVPERLDGPRG